MTIIRQPLVICLLIASLCLLFYSNTLHSPFIWDDEFLILKSPIIPNWQVWYKAFANDLYFGSMAGSNFYRPLQALTLMWDYHFWELDPFGYHLTNILLHALVSFLVFLFLHTISGSKSISFAAALLFAFCPLATESVTYISGRAEILVGLFLLSSLLAFQKSQSVKKGQRMIYLYLSWFLFVLGLLSKELSMVFPLVIIAFVFYLERSKLKKRDLFIKDILPFFIITGVYVALRLSLLKFPTIRLPVLAKTPLLLRITVLPKVILTYIKLLILPTDLHMGWTLPIPVSFTGIFLSWLLLGIIIVSCAYILIYKRAQKIIPFMLFWSLAFLAPQSGILPINAFMAEHFIYLSSISFFMFISYLLHRYLRRELFILAIWALSLFYGLLTYARNFDWQNPYVFYGKMLKFSPQSVQAHTNLGQVYESNYKYEQALNQYQKALEIMPGLLEARSNLANLYFKMGKIKDAKREYALLEQAPAVGKVGEIQNNIGSLYEAEGSLDKALDKYKLALRLNPRLNLIHFNIARIYFLKQELDRATEEILLSIPEIKLRQNNEKLYLKIIADYLRQGKNISCAITFYNDLGVKFTQLNLLDEAIFSFIRSIEAAPGGSADAHFNLGLAYWKKGLRRKAVFEFKAALKLNPHHLKAARFLSEIVYKK